MSTIETTVRTVSPYLPTPCPIKRVDTLTELEKRFVLELPEGRPLGHQPGQFVQVSLFGIGEAPISLCSAPLDGPEFELTVRRVGMVTEAMHRLAGGDVLGIRGPYGSGFNVTEFEEKDILFVAGGIGLAPLRSFIDYVASPRHRDRFGKVTVLYGAKAPDELLFLPDLGRWQEAGGLEVHVTVDRADDGWDGHVGVVTTLFPDLDLDPRRTMIAVVGPPVMYRFVLLEVFGKGIPFSNIRLSLERRMKCGLGVCGHCQINGVYVCKDGPVFRYTDLRSMDEAL
jgi:NAD(P)H-flavin reductase